MIWQLIEESGLRYFQSSYKNYLCLCSTIYGTDLFLKKFKPILIKQVHSETIIDVDHDPARIGDGLTTATGKSIGVKVADCLPVFLFGEKRVCIIHCGWHSITMGIAKKAAQSLGDYKYCLGAAIGSCCYEIKSDVAEQFRNELPSSIIHRDRRIFLNLKKAVTLQLGRQNMISSLEYCTKCHPEYFYSFRRGDRHKRNYAVIKHLLHGIQDVD